MSSSGAVCGSATGSIKPPALAASALLKMNEIGWSLERSVPNEALPVSGAIGVTWPATDATRMLLSARIPSWHERQSREEPLGCEIAVCIVLLS